MPNSFPQDSWHQAGLMRMLQDPVGARRVVLTMQSGNLESLPQLLEPYGLYPIPRDICIPIIKVIQGAHPAGFEIKDVWYRYFTPPPHQANELRLALSDTDIQALKSTYLPSMPPATPTSLWDILVSHGYIVHGIHSVPVLVVVNEARQIEICKVMHGNPVAGKG